MQSETMTGWYNELQGCGSNGYMTTNCIGISYPYYSSWSRDKGQEAFNILKALKAKKMLKIDDIDDFIEAMSIIMKEL